MTFPGGKAMPGPVAGRTGAAVTDGDGQILGAGWARGAGQAIGWADSAAGTVMLSCSPARRWWSATCRASGPAGPRAGQRRGRWKVSAKTTNAHPPRLAGVQFPRLAEPSGRRQSGRRRDDFGRPGRSVYRRQTREPARQQPWEAICAT